MDRGDKELIASGKSSGWWGIKEKWQIHGPNQEGVGGGTCGRHGGYWDHGKRGEKGN